MITGTGLLTLQAGGGSVWSRAIRAIAAVVLPATALGLAAGPAAAGAGTAPGRPACRQLTVPVALAPGGPASWQVTGWVCARGRAAGKTLQVLVPGFTYGAYYWDFPVDPQRYSYVRAVTAAGYATFALDRPGTGKSSHPPAALLTVETEAYAVHQVITALRQGTTTAGRFPEIILAGHSLGSSVAMMEAAAYADESGLILTGALHATNTASRAVIHATEYPAASDPKFAAAGLPDGYVTTRPGTRGSDFYNTAYASPAVIAADERLKQTGTQSEIATIADAAVPAVTQAIRVPVLLAVGQDDTINCGPAPEGLSCADAAAVLARENADYSPAACLAAYVLPLSGHDISLHPDAPDWFAAAISWADRHIGAAARARPARPCDDQDTGRATTAMSP